MSFESMNNNNPNEQPLQEIEDINVDDSFELPEEISEEMESSINEIPEIEKWDSDELSDEEKLEVINTKGEEVRKKITDKMGLELKEDIGEIEDQIKDFRDSLKEKYEGYAEMEESLSQIRDENIEEKEGLNKMQETLSSLKGVYENQLQIEYLEYWKKYKEDPELLLESHAKRDLVMNNWETLIGGLEEAEKGEEEVLRDWVKWVKNNPEITLAALALAIAAGVATGALLGPEIMAALAGIGGEQATEEVIKEIAKEAGPEAAKKGIWVATKGVVGFTTGAAVGLGILGKALSWISDEKNRDSLMKGICGAEIPGFAYWANGRPGSEKK